eukprot:TRINITY_DN12014_c0_g1_i4.p1 TRINITY_DN12014_c0_g1~~TRINITY_DN12014_c0_g1_i4.p1  ORF type:complete len:211 (+),score=27.34 TRINITY_DN12014_c0_g1_i4:550-1182(+)
MTHGLGLYPELNPHTLVTCLYYWMQEIPGGLMSGECVGALESVNAQAGCTSVELCQVIRAALDDESREMTCQLLNHWHRVAQSRTTNLMGPEQLATVSFLAVQCSTSMPSMEMQAVMHKLLDGPPGPIEALSLNPSGWLRPLVGDEDEDQVLAPDKPDHNQYWQPPKSNKTTDRLSNPPLWVDEPCPAYTGDDEDKSKREKDPWECCSLS